MKHLEELTKQPAWLPWLQATVSGLPHPEKYSVVIDGNRYAVIREASGPRYARTTYFLVEKGVNYWNGEWRELGKGRLTGELIARLRAAIAKAEKKTTYTR